MKFFCQFITICLTTAIIKAAPTLPDGETIVRLVGAVADDVSSIAVAKAATTGFVGGVALKSLSDNVPSTDDVYKAVVNTGNSAARIVVSTGNSAARVGEDTWNYVKRTGNDAIEIVVDVDPMEVLDKTEDALLQKNEAVVKGIFESKRKALRALQNFTVVAGDFTTQQLEATNEGIQSVVNLTGQQWEATLEGINALLAITLQNINAVINSTQAGIQVSKTVASDIASELTVENAQIAIDNVNQAMNEAINEANEAISETINDSITAAEEGTSAALNALVQAKTGIQEAAENFDSEAAIVGTKKQFGWAVINSFEEVGKVIEQAGVYKAIDNIVHAFAGVPTKINTMLDEARDAITNNAADDPQAETEVNVSDGGEVNLKNEKVLPKIGDKIRAPALEDEIEKIEKEVVAIENSDKEIEEDLVAIETSDSIPREPEKFNEV